MILNTIINENALTGLKKLDSEGINCIVTSPPYWALRDYGVKGQLGLEPTFKEYITKLCDIFDEVKRVLRKDGTCFVNLGDTYYGSGKGVGGDVSKSKEVYQMPKGWNRPSRVEYSKMGIEKECLICKSKFYGKKGSSFCSTKCLNTKRNDFRSQNRLLPDKTLVGIPFRFALEMINRGWILRNTIIWHKPNCMPSSAKDRFTVDFEYVFFFVKSKKYWFKTQYEQLSESYKNDRRTKGVLRQKFYKNSKYNKNKNFRGYTTKTNKTPLQNPQRHGLGISATPGGRIKRTTWKISSKPFKEAHFATYPEDLIKPMIKAGCPQGGIVLDPFMGAGTTALVALKQNKKFIGFEINKEYIEIATKRIKPLLNQLKINDFNKNTQK